MSKRSLLTLLAAVAVAVGLAVGVIVAVSADARDLVLDLDAGVCFELPGTIGDGDLALVETVGCDREHEAEVVSVGTLDGELAAAEDYPGLEPLLAAADVRCAAALAELGIGDRFGILPLVPDPPSWTRYRGRYACIAIPYGGGTTTGSIAVP